MEPLVREALSIAAHELPWAEASAVGGSWNRAFDPEIDLIGADRAPVARKLFYAGSVANGSTSAFDNRDLAGLQRAAVKVPGFDLATRLGSGVKGGLWQTGAVNQLALR